MTFKLSFYGTEYFNFPNLSDLSDIIFMVYANILAFCLVNLQQIYL